MIGYSRSVESEWNWSGIEAYPMAKGEKKLDSAGENMILPSSPIESVPRLPTEAFPDFSSSSLKRATWRTTI